MIIIRKLNNEDKHKILDLGSQIFREEDEIPLLKKALHLCVIELSLVAVENQCIIGFSLVCKKMTHLYYNFMSKIQNCYELAFLGLSPEYQGRGIGQLLLKEALMQIFRVSSQFTCWLLVDIDNLGAIRLYEKFGFRRWKETSADITPIPGYIMGITHKRFLTNTQPVKICHTM